MLIRVVISFYDKGAESAWLMNEKNITKFDTHKTLCIYTSTKTFYRVDLIFKNIKKITLIYKILYSLNLQLTNLPAADR